MYPVSSCSTFIRPYLNLGYAPDHPRGVNSLPELIAFNAKHNPDNIFGLQTRSGGARPLEISFSQLDFAVKNAATWLVSSGATTGRTQRRNKLRPVAILLSSDVGLFMYMAALLRIGTPVLCLSARLAPKAIAHLIAQTSPETILIDSQLSRVATETADVLQSHSKSKLHSAPNFIHAIGFTDLLRNDHPLLKNLKVPPVYSQFQPCDLDAVIMHSSGTTGLPKPIYHAHAYLLSYAACHRLPEQKDPFSFNVSTLPLYHGFGLLAPSLSLSVGMPFVLPPASVIPTARSTLSSIESTGARYLLSVPSILEDILKSPQLNGLEVLKTLRFVAIGGAPMKKSVGEQLAMSGVKLLNHWGATEIGPIAPIQEISTGYNWQYLALRTDVGLAVERFNGSCRLIGRAPGWRDPFVVQDLLEAHPRDHNQFRIMGRADDLLVLSTGEKIRPSNLERVVAEHPDVKDVVAFGDGQASLGLLIELATSRSDINLSQPEEVEQLLASLEHYLARGNSLTDNHGKVGKEMIILTQEKTKPLVRTDKGSIARKATSAAFAEEIRRCYDRAGGMKATSFPSPILEGGAALLNSIRRLVRETTGIDGFGCSREEDSIDFFEAGMDSLQAIRLRKSIASSLRATPNLPPTTESLPLDFCFQNSTIAKLHTSVTQIMSGTYLDGVVSGTTKESRRIAAMERMVYRYRLLLQQYAHEAAEARKARLWKDIDASECGHVVLLTGSSGSLGCMLLEKLANDGKVSKVICLNRLQPENSVSIRQRQLDSMARRGVTLGSAAWNKIIIREGDLSQPTFGLNIQDFAELSRVSHIIHNAWPVNFSRNLASFDTHVKAVCNLVRLALLSNGNTSSDTRPTRLLFTSSIAVAGKFSKIHPNGPLEVPEAPIEAANTSEFGYAEAKWVCERVLDAASELYGRDSPDGEEPLLQTSNVRIGQMTGPEGCGAWSEHEHFPIIVRASQAIEALPELSGSLSWIPVNRAAVAVKELLFSQLFRPYYHVENPSRQSWKGMLSNLAETMSSNSQRMPLIPFPDWLNRVRALGDDPERNPASKVINFLEQDFLCIASGCVILGTSNARSDSSTMVRSTSLDKKHLEEYVAFWRSVGALL